MRKQQTVIVFSTLLWPPKFIRKFPTSTSEWRDVYQPAATSAAKYTDDTDNFQWRVQWQFRWFVMRWNHGDEQQWGATDGSRYITFSYFWEGVCVHSKSSYILRRCRSPNDAKYFMGNTLRYDLVINNIYQISAFLQQSFLVNSTHWCRWLVWRLQC